MDAKTTDVFVYSRKKHRYWMCTYLVLKLTDVIKMNCLGWGRRSHTDRDEYEDSEEGEAQDEPVR